LPNKLTLVENKGENITQSKGVPEPTLRRLPTYLFLLKQLRNQGLMNISAPKIGKRLKYDSTQVVKDLAYTNVSGKPRVGYNVFEVIQALEEFLGFNRPNDAFLIGTGKLGSALMAYQGVRDLGVKVLAGFDNSDEKVGKQIEGVFVLHMDKLKEMVDRLHVTIAILCVPEALAQKVCDQLVSYGIKAIWNLTPVYLEAPDDIIIQNTSMYSNVAVMLNKLKESNN